MEQNDERVTLRVTREYLQSIDERASQLHRTRSDYIRDALDMAMSGQVVGKGTTVSVKLAPAVIRWMDWMIEEKGWFTSREEILFSMVRFLRQEHLDEFLEQFHHFDRSTNKEFPVEVSDGYVDSHTDERGRTTRSQRDEKGA